MRNGQIILGTRVQGEKKDRKDSKMADKIADKLPSIPPERPANCQKTARKEGELRKTRGRFVAGFSRGIAGNIFKIVAAVVLKGLRENRGQQRGQLF